MNDKPTYNEEEPLQHLVLSAGNGAILADEHRTNTGHKIEVFGKRESFYTRDRRMTDFTRKYKCTECNFESFDGKRLAIY